MLLLWGDHTLCQGVPTKGIFNQSPEGRQGSEAHQVQADPGGASDQGCATEGS